ncbi:MAG: extracellular solute-binding protein, partial [Alphaproteobacteria bacterium]|nr:extracellular solute-binding protein [Alphaproteobacteria bacterium]
MTKLSTGLKLSIAATTMAMALGSVSHIAMARDLTIQVWAGGTKEADAYRMDAIKIAADMLEREYEIAGKELNITVEGKSDFGGWKEFKQAITLSAESGQAPNIVVTSHLDIAPWSQAGFIAPVEDYVDMDAWPINNIYGNLLEISSYNGVTYGLPQDAESRPFFFWKDTMRKLGYSDDQIEALP